MNNLDQLDADECFRKQNVRRIELIQKDSRVGLSVEEKEELEVLEQKVSEFIAAKFPGPQLDWDRLEELEKKLNNDPNSNH
jgi:hypothetical protein